MNGHEWAEVAKTVLSGWQFWVAVTVFILRRPIGGLIGRVTRVGWKDAGLQAEAQQPKGEGAKEAPTLLPAATESAVVVAGAAAGQRDELAATPQQKADLILASITDPIYLEHEKALEKELEGYGVAADPAAKARVLLRYAAGWYTRADYESIYSIVFGSQLALLRRLNADALRHDEVQALHAASAASQYPFESWIGYLLANGLTELREGQYQLTQKGHSFLLFLVQTGKRDRHL